MELTQEKITREPWPQTAIDALAGHVTATCWMTHQKSQSKEERTNMDRHRTWGPLIAAQDCGDGLPAAALALTLEQTLYQQCGMPKGENRRHPVITVANEPNPHLRKQAETILETVLEARWDRTNYAEGATFFLVDVPRHESPTQTISRMRQASTALDQEEGIMITAMPANQLTPVAHYLSQSWDTEKFEMPEDPDRLMLFSTPADHEGNEQHLESLRAALIAAPAPVLDPEAEGHQPIEYAYHQRSRRTPTGRLAVWERKLSHEEVVEIATRRGSRNTDAYRQMAAGLSNDYGQIRNLAPLTAGHTMMLIAAGQLDNVAITDPNGQHPPIIMKGQVRKVSSRQDNTKKRYITTENYSSSIRYMDLQDGRIHRVDEQEPGELQLFFNQRKHGFQETVRQMFPPKVDPTDDQWQTIRDNMVRRIRGRQPIGKQTADAITLAAHLTTERLANLLGRPGAGKTFISLMTVSGLSCSKTLIVCPAHVITTWIDEIAEVLPLARIRICRRVKDNRPDPPWAMPIAECDLRSAMQIDDATPDRPLFIITPQGAASLAGNSRSIVRTVGGERNPGIFRTWSSRAPKQYTKLKESERIRRILADGRLEITNEEVDTCPRCWGMLTGHRSYHPNSNRRDQQCPYCRASLRTADLPPIMKGKAHPNRSYPLLDYVARRCPHWHDILLVDEVQQYKASDTQRGEVIGRCAQASKKVLTLTGTYIGGMASDAFYLLQRTRPGFGKEFKWNQLGAFIMKYGRYRNVYEERTLNNHKTRFRRTSRREVPGYHPMMLNFLMDNSVFTTLADLKRSLPAEDPRQTLPPPESIPVLLPLSDTVAPGDAMSQEQWYYTLDHLATSYAVQVMNQANNTWYVGSTKQALLTGPENCWKGEKIIDHAGNAIASLPALSAGVLYPKEEAMIEIAQTEKQEGRRFLLYCTHTKTRSVVERTLGILQSAGIEVEYMDPDRVKPEERLDWFKSHARQCDGIVVHPNSISTGLNLTEFPTIIWQEISDSAITADQASSRSDRINQMQPVRVYYLAYRETLQHDALSLLASKADAGRSIYGELAKNGLSFMNPMADRFDDIIENELHRELEKAQNSGTDQTAQQTLALVQIRQDHDGLRKMLRGEEQENEDTVLVNSTMNWSQNITVGNRPPGTSRNAPRRRQPRGIPDKPKQMSFL